MLKTFNDDYKAKKEALEENRVHKLSLFNERIFESNVRTPLEKIRKYKKLDPHKNSLKFVMKNEFSVYKSIEYDNYCVHDFLWPYLNNTYEEFSNSPATIENSLKSDNYQDTNIDVFRAMIDNMALTEKKLEELDTFSNLFIELAEHNQATISKINQDLEIVNTNQMMIEKDLIHDLHTKDQNLIDLQSELNNLRNALKEMEHKQNDKDIIIDNLNQMTFLVLVLYVTSVCVFIAWCIYRIPHVAVDINKEKGFDGNQRINDFSWHARNIENSKTNCNTPRTTYRDDFDLEMRFIKNTCKKHNTQIPRKRR